MGISISVHAEVKITGKWVHYGETKFDRNYRLFCRMGCTGRPDTQKEIGLPIAKAKGMPWDVSDLTQLQVLRNLKIGIAMREPSWLDSEEIAKLETWWATEPDTTPLSFQLPIFGCGSWYLGGSTPSTDPNSEIPPEVEDIRWVFWFN